jgi:hypothetical protein
LDDEIAGKEQLQNSQMSFCIDFKISEQFFVMNCICNTQDGGTIGGKEGE